MVAEHLEYVCCDRSVMVSERLSCESSLYWRSLCEHLRSLGAEADEFVDKVLPTGVVYAKFLRRSVCQHQRPSRNRLAAPPSTAAPPAVT